MHNIIQFVMNKYYVLWFLKLSNCTSLFCENFQKTHTYKDLAMNYFSQDSAGR